MACPTSLAPAAAPARQGAQPELLDPKFKRTYSILWNSEQLSNMVYGNYVVQGGKVGGEGVTGARSDRKRNRGFRTAAELNLTLPPPRRAEPDVPAVVSPEPNLLRYAAVPEAESELRRPSFVKRREGGSPPLPTIEEYAPAVDRGGERSRDQRRMRLNLFPLEPADRDGCGFDAAKYFTNPDDGHKFTAKGTHPDSLCRVAIPGDSRHARGVPTRCYRLLRWPAALLVVCVALALFIYYVMPDSAEVEFLQSNATSWEAGGLAAATAGAGFRHRPAQTHPRPTSTAADTGETKTTEIDFGTTMGEIPTDAERVTPTDEDPPITIKFHPVPVYPDTVSPDVQYGNEESPGVRPHTIHNQEADPAQSTLRPQYHQTKGQLALYVKEDEEEAPQDARDDEEGGPVKPRGDKGGEGQGRGFTSGHSKLFGLSAEDAERLLATTRHTPVSPTLPAMYSQDSTTGSSHHDDDGLSCRSTRLERCRRVLRYDLTALPLFPTQISKDEYEELIDDFERLAAFDCNQRVVEFLCHVLEPECTTSSVSSRRPCKKFCEDSVVGCKAKVYPNSTLEAMMECSLYPERDCIPAREPCLPAETNCEDGTCVPENRRCDGRQDCSTNLDELSCSLCNVTEYQCPQGGCIPKQWVCDGYADCVFGEDETNCRAGSDGFMAHPYSKQPPPWAQKFLNAAGGGVGGGGGIETSPETAESILAPRVQLPSNLLPTPSKVDRNRVLETSKMHDPVFKGDTESTELLLMSDSSSAARPYQRTPARRRPTTSTSTVPAPAPTSADPVSELLEDLEKMVDSEKWWEEDGGGGARGGERAGTAHASPCPSGELRCVDGRCIMFSQLCDGHVDCVDSADEDNCGA